MVPQIIFSVIFYSHILLWVCTSGVAWQSLGVWGIQTKGRGRIQCFLFLCSWAEAGSIYFERKLTDFTSNPTDQPGPTFSHLFLCVHVCTCICVHTFACVQEDELWCVLCRKLRMSIFFSHCLLHLLRRGLSLHQDCFSSDLQGSHFCFPSAGIMLVLQSNSAPQVSQLQLYQCWRCDTQL